MRLVDVEAAVLAKLCKALDAYGNWTLHSTPFRKGSHGEKSMSRIIRSLEKSVERPRLLKYVRGVDVLRLEDGQTPDERTPSGAER